MDWASIAGGILGGATDFFSQRYSAKHSAHEAEINRLFQERMSNTAYQRGMKDMKKAGLNPMLAFQKGGASAPSGAMGKIPDMKISGSAVQSALAVSQVKKQGEEINNLKQTNDNLKAQEDLARADKEKRESEKKKLDQDIEIGELAATINQLGDDALKSFMNMVETGEWDAMSTTEKIVAMGYLIAGKKVPTNAKSIKKNNKTRGQLKKDRNKRITYGKGKEKVTRSKSERRKKTR